MKNQSTFRDMVIQSFLKLGEFWGYLPIFGDMGFFSDIFKGYGIPETPSRASVVWNKKYYRKQTTFFLT